jgi:hypothetical protein
MTWYTYSKSSAFSQSRAKGLRYELSFFVDLAHVYTILIEPIFDLIID